MKKILFIILLCYISPYKTNCQNVPERDKIIDSYRNKIKEIFDQKIRIKFKNNILGTGSESENDSYFFPPDKLVYEKYETLCYYRGHHGLAAIFICDNKIFYRTNKAPFPDKGITKGLSIQNIRNDISSAFFNAAEPPSLENDERMYYVEKGFEALKKVRDAGNTKKDYITNEINISNGLKSKIISAFQKMKNLTPSSNEWKRYKNIFSFFKSGCEIYDFSEKRKLISNLREDITLKIYSARDAKNTAETDLYCDIGNRLDITSPVYQLGYNNSFFGFCLPSSYYPPNSLPHLVNNTMDALLSYMESPPSSHTENTLVLELDILHTALDNYKSSEWDATVPEVNKRLFTSIENELGNYALAFPNRPLQSDNSFSDNNMPNELPKSFALLCHNYSSGNFSRIFIIDGNNLDFFELDIKKSENSREAKEQIRQLFEKLFIESTDSPDSSQEKLHYAYIGNDFSTASTILNSAKPHLWKRSQITLSPKTISAIKETWKSLKELTCTSPNYCEFYYFSEYYPTFFDEESPQSYFQECLNKKSPTSPLIDPEDHTFSLLGYEDSYFGGSPPSVFYKSDEIPYLLNDVISDIFELKNDSSLPKQEIIVEKLNNLKEAIQKSFPKNESLTKPS